MEFHQTTCRAGPDVVTCPGSAVARPDTILQDTEGVTRQKFTPTEWNKQDHEMQKVEHYYNLEQLTVIFEFLRHGPEAINNEKIQKEKAARRALQVPRRVLLTALEAPGNSVWEMFQDISLQKYETWLDDPST